MVRDKFNSPGYPMRFVNSVIHEFTTTLTNYDIIIPHCLFEVKKKIVLVEIPYCLKNESSSKQFIKSLINLLTISLSYK